MAKVNITEIRIDSSGRLLIHPALDAGQTFEFIYRAAVGVNWEPESNSLVAPPPKEWSYLDWYENVLPAVASEYRDQLILTSKTRWTNIPADLRSQIEESSASTAT